MQSLNILPENTNMKFYSPLSPDLVRTGTIGDGSCFFHSLLHALNKDNYIVSSPEIRKNIIKKYRQNIGKMITHDLWQSLSNGEVAKIPFTIIFNTILEIFYNIVINFDKYVEIGVSDPSLIFVYENFFLKDSIELYKIFIEYVSLDDFEKYILPESIEPSNITQIISNINNNTRRFLSDKIMESQYKPDNNIIRSLFEIVIFFVSKIGHASFQLAYDEFKNKITNTCSWVDNFTIGLIMDYFDKDIYIIDGSTRNAYNIGGCENYHHRDSIVILWINESHYEIIGSIQPNNSIKRIFDSDDQLIQKLYKNICK
jgi:hypothetical protein